MAATTTGTIGNDTLIGGSGADTLDGGAGSDFLNAGAGDDILRYVLSENTSTACKDIYIGGSGKDTLVMVLTEAEWAQQSVRSQMISYLNHLRVVTNAKTGEVSSGSASDFLFTFGSSTLSVQMVEKLQVVVNGRTVLDSTDSTASAPTLNVTTASGDEDSAIDIGSKISATLTDTDGSEWISGYRITGIPEGATLTNTAGDTFTITGGSITLTPTQLAGLKITPSSNSDADFNLGVTAYSTEMNGNATAASATKTLTVTVNAVADAPNLTVGSASGNEDTAINIGSQITASLQDTDGSETLSITISGIPAGATLANTAGNLPAVVGGSITITTDKLAGLTITPPSNSDEDISLSVTATATEAQAGVAPASITHTLQVTVNPVADAPNLAVGSASGDEDTAINIGNQITASLTDSSETLTITISGIPAGATLDNSSHSVPSFSGDSVTLTPAQLVGLTITPPSNSDEDFNLSVTATSIDGVGGPSASTGPQTLVVTVNPVADAPNLTVSPAEGGEDSAIAIGDKIVASLNDSSETLTVTISGIPDGASLTNTASDVPAVVGGSVTLNPDQLAGLKIMPPSNSDDDFSLSVTATSTDGVGGPSASTGPQTLLVTVNAVADEPNLTVGSASGNEDTAINIGSQITASLNDTDGSETLSITIGNIPAGATLSNTAGDTLTVTSGSVTITTDQLDGLKITPPSNSDLDFDLSVTATATEAQVGVTPASVTQTLSVTVNAVADAPSLTVGSATGNEDTAIEIGSKISATLTDTDGSEWISGYRITGIPDGATLTNTAGDTFTITGGSITLTPTQLAGLKITPPTNSDADFNLGVTAYSTETNGNNTAASATQMLSVTINAVADTPDLIVGSASGNEDTAIEIGSKISASLTDADGSESLTVTISGIPDGASLANTAGDLPAVVGGSITITTDKLAGLTITPPSNSDADLNLSVTATATEGQPGIPPASVTQTLSVTVNAVADVPTLSLQATSGNEDTAIAIGNKITAALVDADGSETLSITISGIPGGAILDNTAHTVPSFSGDSVTLTPAQLAGLTITPPSNSDADFNLSVTATSTDGVGGPSASTGPQTLAVTVNAVADVPTLSVQAASGNEDTAIAIGNKIAAALTDNDGSESLTITISGIPSGATLDNTSHNVPSFSGGSVTLTPAQLAGLTITPPSNSDADFSLSVTATSAEGQAGVPSASVTQLLGVTVNAVADTPTLNVTATSGDANTAIAIGSHISASLTDTDSSESLTITISGIPSGATLDNTGHTVPSFSGGVVTLTPAQLAGLTITPPANSDADFNLSVTATSTESQAGVPSASVTQTLAVTVNDIIVSPQGITLNGGTGNTDFTVGVNDGLVTINDLGGGNDTLTVQTAAGGTAFSTFNFERVGDSLVLTLVSSSGSSTVTVQNHFGTSVGAVETVTFSNGGTAYGYSLGSAGYNLQKDLGGTGQADVIASSALGQSLTGGNGNDLLFGNDGNDIADGGTGNDLLVGGAGNDRLIGGDGNDVLVGGAGSDTFVFNTAPNGSTNVDAIRDFNANGEDFIELASGVFTGLSGTGTLNAGDFITVSGTGATVNFGSNTNVNIIFDTNTGNLYYDSNGGDATGRTLIATLTVPAGTVDATDFKVV